MIIVKIKHSNDERIKSFTISGHANFAKKGEDIVCAGVSAISFGAVNSILTLTAVKPDIEQGKDGFLKCSLPKSIGKDDDEKVQLLLKGMVVSLETIARDYKKFVKITHITEEVD